MPWQLYFEQKCFLQKLSKSCPMLSNISDITPPFLCILVHIVKQKMLFYWVWTTIWSFQTTNVCLGGRGLSAVKNHNVFSEPPVDASWGDWGSWSSCSRTCGGGVRIFFFPPYSWFCSDIIVVHAMTMNHPFPHHYHGSIGFNPVPESQNMPYRGQAAPHWPP